VIDTRSQRNGFPHCKIEIANPISRIRNLEFVISTRQNGRTEWLELDSDQVVLADGDVHFLAGLGDLVPEPLVLALELAGVHAEDFAEEGAMA
jgi:hypothetical protein